MAYGTKHALPKLLNLPEAAILIAEKCGCSVDHAQDLLERAIYGRSLGRIVSFDSDGRELSTDVATWHAIEWESGTVTIEASFSGSPPTYVPIFPLLGRDEVFNTFEIETSKYAQPPHKRGGRPTQHDWDSFWLQICRRIEKQDLPESKKELVDEMLDWFEEHGDVDIDASTVAKKVSRLFSILSKD